MAWAIFSMLFLAIGGVVYGAAALIWFALTILANWLMFMKAGEAGWKSIIPVYNTYTAYKIAWTPNMFWIYFIFTVLESIFSSISGGDFWSFSGFLGGLCGLVTIVLSVFYCVNLAKSFGKGLGFTIGLIFLEPIFVISERRVMKRGCEITVSMEKEDLSFKMNERSSFLLPFRRGYIAKGEVYQRYIHQSVEMKRLKALIPSSVHLYTPASSSTLQNTFPTSCSKICSIFSSVTLSYSDRKASVQSACFAI